MNTTVLWDKFNAEMDIEGALGSHGWTRGRARGHNIEYTRPGKTERDGISATWHTEKRLFYVFTSSSEFEADRAYNAAQVFCVLECGGDMSKTAKKLKELGYYTPKRPVVTGRVELTL
jgi:hypothetical protein